MKHKRLTQTFALAALLAVVFSLNPRQVRAFVTFGTYRVSSGMQLRYVATGPFGAKNEKLETWIYQDGDGNILNPYIPLQNALFARLISASTGVVFIWPELRREALAHHLKQYCALDYKHRVSDLASLINKVKKLPFVDPNRIVLVGSSGGSEIVTWEANRRNDIAAVVTIGGGVLQLADYIRKAGDNPGILDNINNNCTPATYRYRSGLFWRQLLFSGFYREIQASRIPYLAIVGAKDPITKDSITRPYAQMLEKQNRHFNYLSVPGMGHGFGWLHSWRWRIVKQWTARVLRAKHPFTQIRATALVHMND